MVLENSISKITRAKWAGGGAQALEHLLCKCEALSSKPSPAKTTQTNKNSKKDFMSLLGQTIFVSHHLLPLTDARELKVKRWAWMCAVGRHGWMGGVG
jgi:hypothetical protein